MSGNSTVSLTLQIKGQQASNELKKINSDQLIADKKINAEQQKLAPIQAGQFAIAKKIAVELRTQGQALTVQKREAVALDAVRKLGIRTEKQINNEINNILHSLILNLKDVLDSQSEVSLWFYDDIPTLKNEPYIN